MSLATQFLTNIRGFARKQDGAGLRAWLQVSPNAPRQYFELAEELKTGFRGETAIASLVEKCLPLDDPDNGGGGAVWPSFVACMREYMLYWRDVEFRDMPVLYAQLSGFLT